MLHAYLRDRTSRFTILVDNDDKLNSLVKRDKAGSSWLFLDNKHLIAI